MGVPRKAAGKLPQQLRSSAGAEQQQQQQQQMLPSDVAQSLVALLQLRPEQLIASLGQLKRQQQQPQQEVAADGDGTRQQQQQQQQQGQQQQGQQQQHPAEVLASLVDVLLLGLLYQHALQIDRWVHY
jgi:hypothetical protein